MPKLIILLNGPARSGKDTIGAALERRMGGVELMKFADPLRTFVKTSLNWTDEMLEQNKEAYIEMWGMTVRQAMIAYSEDFCKPKFGKEYFGRLAKWKIHNSEADVIVMTDSGFASEAMPLLREFGPSKLMLVHLKREGFTFDGDSRSYWRIEPDLIPFPITNDSTPDAAALKILEIAQLSGFQLTL